jgi:hypothetical protein
MSHKKYSIHRYLTNEEFFASENFEDIRSKLREPEFYDREEGSFIVKNNYTGMWDFDWRVLQLMKDLRI